MWGRERLPWQTFHLSTLYRLLMTTPAAWAPDCCAKLLEVVDDVCSERLLFTGELLTSKL